jgi:hypothetical protein
MTMTEQTVLNHLDSIARNATGSQAGDTHEDIWFEASGSRPSTSRRTVGADVVRRQDMARHVGFDPTGSGSSLGKGLVVLHREKHIQIY